MKYTLFGESHGSKIGIVLENIPAGLNVDIESIKKDMMRRSAKSLPSLSTTRHEPDEVEIISGLFNGLTTGAPLCAQIANTNTRSKDYDNTRFLARPSHSDYAAHIRYNACNDFRGGGHFSGRLTAPLVFAGSLAKQILKQKGIEVFARVREIAGVCDDLLDKAKLDIVRLRAVADSEFPTISIEKAKLMQEQILKAKSEHDSVGGIIECFACGIKAGIGSPSINDNIEGLISRHVFAVPAVKGIEFGSGFELAKMRGSTANDEWLSCQNNLNNPYSLTNHNGGINGGITNGMVLNFSVVIKPTPSIGKMQKTIDMRTNEQAELEIKGRHDPCIVPRAVPVIEAVCALAISTFFEDYHA